MIQITDLYKGFTSGSRRVQVLSGVSLSVEKGNTLAVVGKSGSGKTTLLNCLGGLERPDSGRITCLGTEITALDQRQMTRFRRQHLGFMFQAGNLISCFTVFENIAFPLHLNHYGKKERHRRVNRLLEALSLEGLSRSMPHELSGGQAQRVAFARAVSHVPALLLADEPTASLDSATALHLIRLMADTGRALGVTIIVTTHDKDIIRLSDRTIRLTDGKTKEGNHAITG
ncbi:MAG: ABC transporter ATP-binding protein [Desulfotignum sp.]|nr:ABC transporter ATP-binding protein [Desulfotignum sp.]MCF8139292.1 ABC transporter ATP-binding protein [Desulfotignum sp.]